MRKIGGLIALVLAALLVIVGCDNSTVTNDGNDEWLNHISGIIGAVNPDDSWYDENASGAQTYELSTTNELLGLVMLVNKGTDDFADDTIKLVAGATYDLSSISSLMEGTASFIGYGDRKGNDNAFAGKFYGNNAVIKGVDLSYLASASDSAVGSDGEDNMGVGFFGVVKGTSGSHAVVRDLTFEDCTLISTSNTTGIAVGYAEYADIENIIVRNSTVIGPQGVGAVVGRVYQGGSIKNCDVVNTTVKATADGTADYTDGSGSGNYNAGGIVGCVKGTASTGVIDVSDNTVDLTEGGEIYADYLAAGGICGTGNNASFSRNKVLVNTDTQIAVGTGGNAAAFNANGTITYGTVDDVNKITIGGTLYDTITSAADDDMTTIVV